MHHVTIRNQGINRQATQQYWKNEIKRHESVHIILHEEAEFYAEGVTLEGHHHFEVPAHHRLVLQASNGKLKQALYPIKSPCWFWHYTFDNQEAIHLEKIWTKEGKCDKDENLF